MDAGSAASGLASSAMTESSFSAGGALGAAKVATDGWEASETHYPNIVGESYTALGVGYFLCEGHGKNDGRYYFTTFFGPP